MAYDFEDDGPVTKWVIPHGSSLDYCQVTIIGTCNSDPAVVAVLGRRTHSWIKDKAMIRTKVPADKLTDIPSWSANFLQLYDDPCNPNVKN